MFDAGGSMSEGGTLKEYNSKQLSSIGMKAFFNITAAWNLKSDEEIILLGSPLESIFCNWKADPSSAILNQDCLERISYILGIYKALQILIPDPMAADEWIKKSNSEVIFGGRSALDRMLSGNVNDLRVVRHYLDPLLV